MSVPKVFISSTIYDLRHVRNAIKEFIDYYGFKPILSENFDVFYKSGKSAQESCLEEIKNCDFYILIIGSRYGALFGDESISNTHREYKEALKKGLKVFAFVDQYVHDEYKIYDKNRDVDGITYEHVQDTKVFNIISDVESHKRDNALIRFDLISDIIDYLRKHLARMFKENLSNE